MILRVEKPKDFTQNKLELRNNKVAGHEINIQKALAFLYINSKRSEKKIKKTIAFTIASKRIR